MYVLYGGYKAFFENHKSYCDPPHYTPMADKAYEDQLKFYKSKSKNELITKAKVSSSVGNKMARQLSINKKLSDFSDFL